MNDAPLADARGHRATLELTATPDPHARSAIGDWLDSFNTSVTGIADGLPLDVLLRSDATHEVIGGLVGRTSLGVLFVDYLFVPDVLRGQGQGRRLLAVAEAEAIRRGCATAVLFTMVIQAPGFYAKLGYETFGRIDCEPPGNARVFMRKQLG